MIMKNFFQYANPEGLQIHPTVLPSIEGFIIIVKQSMHHTIYAATSNEMYMSVFMISVPDVLDVAGNCRIHSKEVLELVEH